MPPRILQKEPLSSQVTSEHLVWVKSWEHAAFRYENSCLPTSELISRIFTFLKKKTTFITIHSVQLYCPCSKMTIKKPWILYKVIQRKTEACFVHTRRLKHLIIKLLYKNDKWIHCHGRCYTVLWLAMINYVQKYNSVMLPSLRMTSLSQTTVI